MGCGSGGRVMGGVRWVACMNHECALLSLFPGSCSTLRVQLCFVGVWVGLGVRWQGSE